MASTRNATYKIYNGTDWDTYYFKTSAGQVGESSSLVFLRPATHKVNGKTFGTYNSTSKTWTHNEITLYGSDIKMSDAADAKTIKAAIEAIQDDYVTSSDLTNYEYAVVTTSKAGLAPSIPTTDFNQADSNTIVLAYRMGNSNTPEWVPLPTNAFKNDNTWRNIYINNTQMSSTTEYKGINFVGGTGITLTPSYNSGDPYRKIIISMDDSALGNVKYAGLFNPNDKEVTLTDDVGAVTNLKMTLPTTDEIRGGGLDDNTYFIPAIGNYFIATADGTFNNISFVTGDWIIWNGMTSGWGKVDNTDAVTSVIGKTGNITTADIKSVVFATILGSATKPIYISSTGTLSEGSQYAGGTAVTLNGTSKAASTASFYAPTTAGTSGYLLQANGNTPTWVAMSSLHVGQATKDGSGNNIADTYATKTALNNVASSYSSLTSAVTELQNASHKVFTGSTTPTGMKTGDIWLQY